MQSTCKRHGTFSKYRCPVCHRPLCSHCKTRDGCCSRRCAWRRRKFGVIGRLGGDGDETSCGGALLKVVLVAAAVAGALYAAHRAGLLPS